METGSSAKFFKLCFLVVQVDPIAGNGARGATRNADRESPQA
jgi:hypothetical protein